MVMSRVLISARSAPLSLNAPVPEAARLRGSSAIDWLSAMSEALVPVKSEFMPSATSD